MPVDPACEKNRGVHRAQVIIAPFEILNVELVQNEAPLRYDAL